MHQKLSYVHNSVLRNLHFVMFLSVIYTAIGACVVIAVRVFIIILTRGRFLKKNCGNAKLERRRRESIEALRGWSVGRGCPPPHRGRGLETGLCPLPRNVFRFSISNRPILVQTGCFLCSSHKAGLNAILVRVRPKCQNLAVCMLSYGEIRHHSPISINQSIRIFSVT